MIRMAKKFARKALKAARKPRTVAVAPEAEVLVSAADVVEFRRMLDLGSHGAQGLQARERCAAMRAVDTLKVVNRAQLAELVHAFDQGRAVRELVRLATVNHW